MYYLQMQPPGMKWLTHLSAGEAPAHAQDATQPRTRIDIRGPHAQLECRHTAKLTVGPKRLLTRPIAVVIDLLGCRDVVLDIRHPEPISIKGLFIKSACDDHQHNDGHHMGQDSAQELGRMKTVAHWGKLGTTEKWGRLRKCRFVPPLRRQLLQIRHTHRGGHLWLSQGFALCQAYWLMLIPSTLRDDN